MEVFLQGFLLQASLILALGAQNLFVLDSGLKRRRHLFVAFVCSVCDIILILLGVLGAASVFLQVPVLKIIFGLLGVGFLVFYGVMKLGESLKPNESLTAASPETTTLKQTLLATLGFSLLNPHVYLDTVVLIGGYAAQFPATSERFFFGLGAGSFSTIWFFGLAFLASVFNRLIHNRFAMRLIALVSGAVLLWLAVKLGGDVWVWIQVETNPN
ncbi:MAG: amino acid transporter [Rhizobacter sp.]|nr:amino acid transporter [Chlorobiales bacterium]